MICKIARRTECRREVPTARAGCALGSTYLNLRVSGKCASGYLMRNTLREISQCQYLSGPEYYLRNMEISILGL